MNEWIRIATQFVKEAYAELTKVTWLSRKEAVASTLVVIVLVIIVAIFVGVIDLVLARVLGVIL